MQIQSLYSEPINYKYIKPINYLLRTGCCVTVLYDKQSYVIPKYYKLHHFTIILAAKSKISPPKSLEHIRGIPMTELINKLKTYVCQTPFQ